MRVSIRMRSCRYHGWKRRGSRSRGSGFDHSSSHLCGLHSLSDRMDDRIDPVGQCDCGSAVLNTFDTFDG